MKKCIHCGADLPDNAAFCPVCAKSQTVTEKTAAPRLRKKALLIALPVAILAIAAILFLLLYHKPVTINADEAELVYKTKGTTYHVLLRNTAHDIEDWKTPLYNMQATLARGTEAAVPLQLYVYDEKTGENAKEAFSALIGSSSLVPTALNGTNPVKPSDPEPRDHFPDAVMESDIMFGPDETDTMLDWTLNMKNGDKLILHNTIKIDMFDQVSYSYEDTDLDSMEKLQALIDSLATDVEPGTAVTITLAPIVYEGDLHIPQALDLIGTSDENGSTTIHGTLYSDADSHPVYGTVMNVNFTGEGTAIEASALMHVNECTFTGVDTGINVLDGAWMVPTACTFTDCKVGLYFNSTHCKAKNVGISENTFTNCETAVLLENVPDNTLLYFLDNVFEDCGEDIVNHSGSEISFTY